MSPTFLAPFFITLPSCNTSFFSVQISEREFIKETLTNTSQCYGPAIVLMKFPVALNLISSLIEFAVEARPLFEKFGRVLASLKIYIPLPKRVFKRTLYGTSFAERLPNYPPTLIT